MQQRIYGCNTHVTESRNNTMILGKWIVVTTVAIGCMVLVAYTAVRNIENILAPDKPRRPSRPLQAVCHTKDCQLDAKAVLQSLNESVDPCDDFYQFACGGFFKDNPVKHKEGKFRISHFTNLEKEVEQQLENIVKGPPSDKDTVAVNAARTMYKACMDTEKIERDGLQPLLALSNEFGGWPMTLEHWEGDNYTSVEIMDITKRLLVSPLNNVLVKLVQNSYNGSLNVKVTVYPSMLHSKNLGPVDSDEKLEKYKQYIRSTALLVMNTTGNYRNEDRVEEETNQIVEFEMALDKISPANCTSESLSLKELQEWSDVNSTAQHDWSSLVSHFLSSAGITDYDEDTVLFRDVGCLKDLVKLVDVTPFRVIANTLQWRGVQAVMGENIKEIWNFFSQFSGDNAIALNQETKEERHTFCYELVDKNFRPALAQKIVNQSYTAETDKAAHDLLKNIRSAFNSRIAHAHWLDKKAKLLVTEKADAMKVALGYPKWYDEPFAMENYYYKLNASDIHFNNILNIKTMVRHRNLKSSLNLQSPNPMEQDEFDPLDVNAYSLPYLNSIQVTAAFIRPPLYRVGRHEALNYGSFGEAVAHEICHGFDVIGLHYDKYGRVRDWLPHSVNSPYFRNARCFWKQYDDFRLPELDNLMNSKASVNGEQTLGENIADNVGVGTAFLAYSEYLKQNGPEPKLPGLERYSSEQLFFIGYATTHCSSVTDEFLQDYVMTNSHSPSAARIIVPLSNSADFAAAFRCPVDSRMNPEEKCGMW